MRKFSVAAVTVAALSLSGCASGSQTVEAAKVDAEKYSGLNCQQLEFEVTRSADNLMVASKAQDAEASKDALVTGMAIMFFVPLAVAAAGDNGEEAELALRKGEFKALEQTVYSSNCGLEQKYAERSAEIEAYYEIRRKRVAQDEDYDSGRGYAQRW
ncbi:hypothetical protein [Nisaea denitrificans]|uniref:hypothetical protein n=1 Tax=Nisaea denitrificans TaxID=390877 RepID=UPI000403D376|nr:hypothetical protein [Nisaea denitrificans]